MGVIEDELSDLLEPRAQTVELFQDRRFQLLRVLDLHRPLFVNDGTCCVAV
ncbi:hypothetical protein GbCGDNIH3_7118 [Granulibacter bethesdensis]|uniref:Uncharacterized protein n=1 Tax=Granulibacter bethesdensis TaxID=364410 RepID=A0AAN0RDP6_9PROT|nr:hypothetical protein GbCGDNIH3_7118 [Granulibacter bethesdensis]AHJ66513.1 hypothetical protein GbCGDNIH4_7141 [Granulibacter bethesdensis CGDNIH4]APH59441.1 hypothetical protein GbCGDNIH7_7118 [Granulibacter bethesdensis]